MPSKEKKQERTKADVAAEAVTRKWQSHPVLYIFSFALLVIIVVTFVGTPVAAKAGDSGPKLLFGSYDGKKIEYTQGSYLARQRDIIADQVASTGSNGEDVQQQALRVWRGAFESTVFHFGVLDLADQSGMTVTDSKVDEYLVSYPSYQENGRFSETRYRNTPASERYMIRKLSKDSIIQQQYLEDVISSQLSSKAELEFIKDMLVSERKVRYAYFSMEDFPSDQLVAFAEKNPTLFQRMKLSRISVSTREADAKQILEKIRNNTATFEDLAKASSTDSFAEKGGDMGYRYYHEIRSQFTSDADVDTVFALPQGEVSPVIKTASGWAIYRADEAKQAPDYSAGETLSAIRSYMTVYERGTIEDYLVKKAEAFKTEAAGKDFVEAAAGAGLKTGSTDFFPINKGPVEYIKPVQPETAAAPATEQNPVLEAVAGNEQFFTKVFALEQNGVSDPVIAGDYVVVAQVTETREAPAEEVQSIMTYFPYLDQRYQQNIVYQNIMTSPKLEDNFYEVFFKYFLPSE